MAFKIEPVRQQDLEAFSSVIFRSHRGESHYVNCAYPDNLTSEGQRHALKKLQDSTANAEHTRWEKATDTDTGEIVGAAIWATFETRKPGASSPSEEKEMRWNEEYVLALNSSIAKTEAPFWEGNALPLTSLAVLAVSPEHQYKGVGTLLVASGLKHADSIGAKVSVVSTDAGRWLYEKCGFKVESHVALEVPEKFSTEEKVEIFFMVRERLHDS